MTSPILKERRTSSLFGAGSRGQLVKAALPRPRLPAWPSGTIPPAVRSTLAPVPGSRSTAPAAAADPDGPAARNSGLDLLASQRNPTSFGILKTPVAAGLGSGGLSYDIVPGQADRSILAYRIASTHPRRHDAQELGNDESWSARGRGGSNWSASGSRQCPARLESKSPPRPAQFRTPLTMDHTESAEQVTVRQTN